MRTKYNISRIGLQECVGARDVRTNDRPIEQMTDRQRRRVSHKEPRQHMKKIADVRESVVMKQQHRSHASYERTVYALVVSMTLVKELNCSS